MRHRYWVRCQRVCGSGKVTGSPGVGQCSGSRIENVDTAAAAVRNFPRPTVMPG
ncbi:hypothetical protein QFZ66_008416 [Streptomyces sp. B4I13]|nr:hypothetical protein [Streptomyces sp. B4I13]